MKQPLRGWRLLLFARCEHAQHIESDEWDGPVERDRWWAARLHRLSCGPCRRSNRGMRWLRRVLSAAPEPVRQQHVQAADAVLSAAAAERIRRSLSEAQHESDGCC